jgi:hypothetical protein
MSDIPKGYTKTFARKRVIINATGNVWGTWHRILDDGTLVIDRDYRTQYAAGEWRFIIERETRTVTYEEA